MGRLFARAVDLVVGQKRVTGLRAAFVVKKGLDKHPNSLDLRIWNLSDQTIGTLQNKGTPVVVVAGYEGESGQIFSGDSRHAETVADKADRITKLECGDGEKAYAVTRVSESFGPGTPVADIVAHLVRKLGINPGNAIERIRKGGHRAGFQQYAHGYVATGRASDELARVLRSAGLTWSIQDGALQVLAPHESAPDEVVLLSSSSGLIGSPVYGTADKEDGSRKLKVRSLLRALYRPGRRVKVQSRGVDGVFRIDSVTHTGDTAGGDWYSDLEVVST